MGSGLGMHHKLREEVAELQRDVVVVDPSLLSQ